MQGAIIDLDGTVYHGEQLIPGAKAGIEQLRGAGMELLFFSNNPTKDGQAYANTLRQFGLSVDPAEACSAGVVTTEYLDGNHSEEPILCIGSDGLCEQLRAADLHLTTDPAKATVLVASWTPEFEYADMQAALDAIDEQTTFLGTDPDRTFPMPDGKRVPASGAVIGAVAAVVGREPDAVLGKPSDAALDCALDRLDVPPEECLIVGDRLDTDLAMGARAGMTTVLVLSGITDRTQLQTSEIQPDHVIENLGDIGSVL